MPNFTGIVEVPFTGTTTGLNAKKIVNGAPTGDSLTAATQLTSTGDSWGSFTDTSGGTDSYSVYFFFSASSLNASGSTHTEPQSQYTGCVVDNKIYKITDTGADNLYAIKITFPERYEASADTQTYTSDIVLKTNDEDVSLSKTISISHTYCKSAS